ncbi:MAG: hypothetical protein HOP09_16190 [Hyphomicrobium sp.]|nr:hypothetical protein [Hyphomicrobium sp.]
MTTKTLITATLLSVIASVALGPVAMAAPGERVGDRQSRNWTGKRDENTDTSASRRGANATNHGGSQRPAVIAPRPPVVAAAPVHSGHRDGYNNARRSHGGDTTVYNPRHQSDGGYDGRGHHVDRYAQAGDDRPHRRHRRHWWRRWW